MHVTQENIIDNYTDGIYEGVQYFKSQLRRGIFVKLQALQPDKRFVPQKYFYIGSRVQFGRDKECGVITWMGSVPGCDEECVKIITVSCTQGYICTCVHINYPLYRGMHMQQQEVSKR